jgi:RNA polymerase sigma-70 factor (ECF subfamily)
MDDPTQWLAAARAGSREALGQALEAYRGYLLLVAQEELDPALRAKGGASDLVQETFLEAQRDFGLFAGTSDEEWRAWLRQLLRHNLADFARRYRATGKRKVAREVRLAPDSSSSERGPDLAADTPTPSRLASANEQVQLLQRAMDRLPEDQRLVIILRHQEKLPFEEIAVRMNRSCPAVRQLWARAVRRLRLDVEGRS